MNGTKMYNRIRELTRQWLREQISSESLAKKITYIIQMHEINDNNNHDKDIDDVISEFENIANEYISGDE